MLLRRLLHDANEWSPPLDDQINIDGSRLRLQTIIRLRWVAVAGQTVTVLWVYWGFGFQFPWLLCMAVIALSALLNIALQLSFPASKRLVSRYALLMLGYDVLQLSALIYLTGGLQNPFALLVVVPVAVSAATQPLIITTALAAFAVLCATLLARFHLPLPWTPGETLQLPFTYISGLWIALVSCIIFIALYAWRTGRETRQMSEALAATEIVLAREQQLSALDGLAAAAAHKLGTPLSTIVVIAKEIERAIPPESPLHEDVLLLRSQALRCREILGALTRHSGESDEIFSNLRLTHLLEDVVEPYRVFGIAVTVTAMPAQQKDGKPFPEPVIRRNPGIIYGLGNLVENAVDFAASAVAVTARWDQHFVSIEIMDDGPGFSPNVMSHLGEPYLSTRSGATAEDRRVGGMGLGFFIAKTLLERSGATLTMSNRSSPETGAVISISWPRARLALVEGPTKAQP